MKNRNVKKKYVQGTRNLVRTFRLVKCLLMCAFAMVERIVKRIVKMP